MEDDFVVRAHSVSMGRNGFRAMGIFTISIYLAHDRIRIWMFLPMIQNRVDLKDAIRNLHYHGFVNYSDDDCSFQVRNTARMIHRDFTIRLGYEEKALKAAFWLLKKAKPSYYSHFVSVYLQAKQYLDLFKNLGDLPGNMLQGMIKGDRISVWHGQEWTEFLTGILGESHWTVLHLRSRLALALLELGGRDEAVDVLVDVYRKTCNNFGDTQIRDILCILAEVIFTVSPSEEKAAEMHLRQVVFGGKKVSDCQNNSELEMWMYYVTLLRRFGFTTEGISILDDVIQRKRRLIGPRDVSIDRAMQAKAQLLSDISEYNRAFIILQNLEKRRRRRNLDDSNPKILEIMNAKGHIFRLLGNLEKALDVFYMVVALARRGVGENHPVFLFAITEMVDIYMLQNKFHKALELCPGIQENLAAVYGVVHPLCFTFRKHLAAIFCHTGSLHKAFRTFKDLFDDFENSYEHETALKSLWARVKAVESNMFECLPYSLHYRVRYGHMREVVQIANLRSVDITDPLGHTPLHYASAFEKVLEARVLLFHGAAYDCITQYGCQALDLAKRGGEMYHLLTTVHSFFEAIADNDCDAITEMAAREPCVMGASDTCGSLPMHFAVRYGHPQVVQKLLEMGASPVAVGKMGTLKTPMMLAAGCGHVEVVEYLLGVLGTGALRDHDDSLLPTPLHMAAEGGHLGMVRYLLSRGAVFCRQNCQGQMARQVTRSPAVKDLLRFIEGLFQDTRKGKVEGVIARLKVMKEEEKEAVAGTRDGNDKTLLEVTRELANGETLKEAIEGFF